MTRRTLTLILSSMMFTSIAQAGIGDSSHSKAIPEFKSGRGNGVAGITGRGDSDSAAGVTIDPGRRGLTATQYRDIRENVRLAQDSYRAWKERLYSANPGTIPTLDQWWASLSSAIRTSLASYGITQLNVGSATVGPYFSYDTAGNIKQLWVVDQDLFNSRTLTGYKNKTVTKYRTEYYSYPVWYGAGCDICPSYIAYYETGSYQVAYTETTQVPSSYSIAVEAVTPTKFPEPVTTTIQVPQTYTDYEPVWYGAGCDICPSYIAYYQPVTRTQYVAQSVTTLELINQVSQNDDRSRANVFAPAGATPDTNSNITFTTDADGNIVYQTPQAAATAFSGSASSARLLNNRPYPQPQ